MKRISILVISLIWSIAVAKNSTREGWQKADIKRPDLKVFINLMPHSHFLQWYMGLHHEIDLKQAQLRLATEEHHGCLSNHAKKKHQVQKELNDLYEQKAATGPKIVQIKKELQDNGFIESLQNSCGRVVFYSDSAEAFADGECYLKVHAVLQYLEARQKIHNLIKKSDRADQFDLAHIHNVTKDLLHKVLY